MWRHIQRVVAAKPGRIFAVIIALFIAAFFALPGSGEKTAQNHFAKLGEVFLSRRLSMVMSGSLPSGTAHGSSSGKKMPSPVLASLVLLNQEYSPSAALAGAENDEENEGALYLDTLPAIQGVAFFESSAPSIEKLAGRGEIYSYAVEENDTPIGIADLFGISLETLLWANNLTAYSIIRPGDKISILPVNGVSHTVAKGDTVSSLAAKYRANADDIIAFNNLSSGAELTPGTALIIPDAIKPAPPAPPRVIAVSRQTINAPAGWLIQPAAGRNPRRGSGLHGFNGVDIANDCGTPIVAAAAGTVFVADDIGWNGGYGKYIKLQHPNGAVTLYAHLKELLVGAGVEIAQGEGIALMGTSGRSTGCHVHFEVRGARNPFVRR